MSARTFTFLLVALLGLSACKKDELVVAELTTNPFDADYNGAPIFTVVSSSTSLVTINSVLVRQLKVTVQVHTELFGRPTPYLVRSEPLFSGNSSQTTPSANTGDRFDIITNNVLPSTEYCWQLNVGNGGNYGGGNSICATAD
jgi:hypothetical protein